jgi:phage terminase small subunit
MANFSPVPKNAKTINDCKLLIILYLLIIFDRIVFNIDLVSAYASVGHSPNKSLIVKHKINKNVDALSSIEYDGEPIRNLRSGRSNKSEISYHKHVNRLNKVNKSVHVRPKNDYDVDTIDDGLNEINAVMDFLDLEENIPEDLYENDGEGNDFDVESFVESNHKLRDQIKDIVVIVKAAITKAAAVKKTITTHRDPPADPVVKAKQKEIKNYQY